MDAKICGLFSYPLKSGQALTHTAIELGIEGLLGDRRYALVDHTGHFLSQRRHPKMALLKLVEQNEREVNLHWQDQEVKLAHQGREAEIHIWSDRVDSLDFGLADAISCLPRGARLLKVNPQKLRFVSSKYAPRQKVPFAFADGFPLLVTSHSSLEKLNATIIAQGGESRSMECFRPNVVISGWPPFLEDRIRGLRLKSSGAEILTPKPCQRCKITTVNQQSGEIVDNEPLRSLRLLSTERGVKGVVFGQNGYLSTHEKLQVSLGDIVEAIF